MDLSSPSYEALEDCEICRAFLDVATYALQVETLPNPDEASIERIWMHSKSETSPTSKCKAHVEFLTGLLRRSNRTRITGDTFRLSYRKAGALAIYENSQTFARLQVISPTAQHYPALARRLCVGRNIDSSYIDLSLIRQWRSFCEDHHGIRCSKTYVQTPSSFPTWLIDTAQDCLVEGSYGTPFAALSYVWGQIDMLKTQVANLGLHRESGAFKRTKGHIPRTIRDAMRLVPLIGERYLWVDSLCIVQDDAQSLQYHLNKMAMIFESAVVTIVAGEGGYADYGLRGIPAVSAPRVFRRPELKLTKTVTIAGIHDKIWDRTSWTMRGWTMQEALFSRRMIHFADNSIGWECRSNTYCETIDAPLDLARKDVKFLPGSFFTHMFSWAGSAVDYPDMMDYAALLYHYNHRAFTFEEDVMRAIESTLASLQQRSFPRGFLQGIPISFFDLGLLWSGAFGPRQASTSSCLCAPSWTWAGWRGLIRWNFHRVGGYIKDNLRASPSELAAIEDCQVIPYLNWHICAEPNSRPEPIPYQNEWYDFKCRYMGQKNDLPAGWEFKFDTSASDCSRPVEEHGPVKPQDGQMCPDNAPTNYHYIHESIPGIKFCYPVPFGNSLSITSERVNSGRYLWVQTQQARLRASLSDFKLTDWSILQKYSRSFHSTILLREADSQPVGDMNFNSRFQCESKDLRKMKTTGDCHETKERTPIELVNIVALSRGTHWPGPTEPSHETYSHYNVIAVRWENGIAYREGIGRVERDAWESLEKENIDLILG